MRYCAARNCKNKLTKGLKRSFHRFPMSRPDMVHKWVQSLNQGDYQPGKHSNLCSDHFEEACFDRTGQTIRLREGAVPTIFKQSDEDTPAMPDIKMEMEKSDRTRQIYPASSSHIGNSARSQIFSKKPNSDKNHQTSDPVRDSSKSSENKTVSQWFYSPSSNAKPVMLVVNKSHSDESKKIIRIKAGTPNRAPLNENLRQKLQSFCISRTESHQQLSSTSKINYSPHTNNGNQVSGSIQASVNQSKVDAALGQTSSDCIIKETKPSQASKVCIIKETKPGPTANICIIKDTRPGQTSNMCIIKEPRPCQTSNVDIIEDTRPGQTSNDGSVKETRPCETSLYVDIIKETKPGEAPYDDSIKTSPGHTSSVEIKQETSTEATASSKPFLLRRSEHSYAKHNASSKTLFPRGSFHSGSEHSYAMHEAVDTSLTLKVKLDRSVSQCQKIRSKLKVEQQRTRRLNRKIVTLRNRLAEETRLRKLQNEQLKDMESRLNSGENDGTHENNLLSKKKKVPTATLR